MKNRAKEEDQSCRQKIMGRRREGNSNVREVPCGCCVCGSSGSTLVDREGSMSPADFRQTLGKTNKEGQDSDIILWSIHNAYENVIENGGLSVKIHAHFPDVPKSRLLEPGAVLCTLCFQVILNVLELEKEMLRMKAKLNVEVGTGKEKARDSRLRFATCIESTSKSDLKPEMGSRKKTSTAKKVPSNNRSRTRKPAQSNVSKDKDRDIVIDSHLQGGYQTRARMRGAFAGLSKEIIKAELTKGENHEEESIESDVGKEKAAPKPSKPAVVKNISEASPSRPIEDKSMQKCGPSSSRLISQTGLKRKCTVVSKRKEVKSGRKKKRDVEGESKLINELEQQQMQRASTITSDSQKFFCCPKCCSYFGKEEHSNFTLHLRDNCQVKKCHPCKTCSRIFTTKRVLSCHIDSSHEKPHPNSKRMRVKPRNEYVSDLTRIHENLQKSSKDQAVEVEGEVDNQDSERCSAGKKTTSGSSSFENLFERVKQELEDSNWPEDQAAAEFLGSSNGTWKCWVCFYESHKKSFWLSHMNRIHPNAKGKSVTCQHCKFPFTQRHHLREHLHEAHQDKIGHSCDSCGRKLLDKNKSKHRCSKIECHICGEQFETKSERSKHLLRHPEYRPYPCQICDKTFQKGEYLSLHMRVHNDIRPYGCEFCSKRFRLKTHYNNHRRLHTGETPYVCHECGRTFSSPQGLHNHMQSGHEEIKKFSCSVCGKQFKTAYDVKRHEAIHTGNKPFQCKTCNKAFNRKGNCLVHERKHVEKEQNQIEESKRNRRKSKTETMRVDEEVIITEISHATADYVENEPGTVILDSVKDAEKLVMSSDLVPVVFTVI